MCLSSDELACASPRSVAHGDLTRPPSARQAERTLGIALALGVGSNIGALGSNRKSARLFLGNVALQVSNRDRIARLVRAGHLCQSVASCKGFWVFLPSNCSVSHLLGHDRVPGLGLQYDVKAAQDLGRSLHAFAGLLWRSGCAILVLLNVLRDFHDFLLLPGDLALLALRRRVRRRINRSNELFSLMSMCGPDLVASQLVDAEPDPVLGGLVEDRR
mmetsp:Transcript_23987/g.50936  ORF Transcript_23987/g.50936 Transcript_23987/m.50936 type:complete len:217 (+) Transcript_23987:20-670(+)